MNILQFVVLLVCWCQAFSFHRIRFSAKGTGRYQPTGVRTSLSNCILPPVQCVVGDGGTNAILPPTVPPPNSYEDGSDRGHYGENYMVLSALWLTSNRTMHDHDEHAAKPYPYQLFSQRDLMRRLYSLASMALQFTLFAVAFLAHRLRILANAAPTVATRLSHYLNPPLAMLISLAVSKPTCRIPYLQATLWASVALGSLCLLYDLCRNQNTWRPLQPTEDSYALVTGAQDGIGRELAGYLYRKGYNLILVDDDAAALEGLRQILLQGGRGEPGLAGDGAGSHWNRTVQAWSARLPSSVQRATGMISRGVRLTRPVVSVCATSAGRGVRWLGRQLLPGTSVNSTTAAIAVAPDTPPSQLHSAPVVITGFTSLLRPYSWLSRKSRAHPPSTAGSGPPGEDPAPKHGQNGCQPSQAFIRNDFASAKGHVHYVVTDCADPEAPLMVVQDLQRAGVHEKVEVVVHAAQRASAALVTDESFQNLQDMLQANAYFPMALTKLLLPGMLTRLRGPTRAGAESWESPTKGRGGRILFFSTLSPAGPAPGASVAAATAAFITSFAQSLRRELVHDGILVTVANLAMPDPRPVLPPPPRTAEGVATSLTLPPSANGTVTSPSEPSPEPERILLEPYPPSELDERMTPTAKECDIAVPSQTSLARSMVPFRELRTRAAAREIYYALESGLGAITPGVLGRLYRHAVVPLLPAPVLGVLHQATWSPAPKWMCQSTWQLPTPALSLADKERLRVIRQGALDSAARATSELQRLGGAAVVILQQLQQDLRERFSEGLE